MYQVILLIVAAAIFYAIQGTLYTKYARKYDGMRISQVRNLSMIFTGLPLLFLSPSISGSTILAYLPIIIICGIIGAIHVFIAYKSYTYVPAGIGQVIKISIKSITVLIISMFILYEVFTTSQGWGLGLISVGALLLGSSKIDIRHLDLKNVKLGIILTIFAGILSAVSWYVFSLYNSAFDSYLASYILEASIGLVYIPYILRETYASKKPGTGIRGLQEIETKDILAMAGITFFVLGGTVCTALAISLGGYGFAGLLSIIGVPMAFILGGIILKEKITLTQALAVGVVLVGLWVL